MEVSPEEAERRWRAKFGRTPLEAQEEAEAGRCGNSMRTAGRANEIFDF